jgi:hypothetical protein
MWHQYTNKRWNIVRHYTLMHMTEYFQLPGGGDLVVAGKDMAKYGLWLHWSR